MTPDRRQFLTAASAAALAAGLPAAPKPGRVPAVAATRGPKHHFFGYYDKSPWDATRRYLLAHEVDFVGRQPKPGEALSVGMVDLKAGKKFAPLGRTAAWAWQQGAMLQWLGSDPDRLIVFNAVEDGRYAAKVLDVFTGKSRSLPMPVYALSRDGEQAVTLDFARLNRLRPGYGYMALPEKFADDPAPKQLGVWHVGVASGEARLVVSLDRLAKLKPRPDFKGAYHWVNHLQFNPSGSRFLFLHRWKRPGKRGWKTRLLTCKPDGGDLRLTVDTGYVSHFDWRDDETILAWSTTPKRGQHFYLFGIDGGEPTVVGGGVLTRDGHCSYSPGREWVLNDTYPDKKRMQTLMLFRPKDGKRIDLNQFFLPRRLTGPWRCDLHPRWRPDGKAVCIDSAHEATRQMYILDVSHLV